jgi:glycosyltransferase involved in cell wall biosynthesis
VLRGPMSTPKRVLMTLDAVGGQWRYSVDLARCLAAEGIKCLLVGFGPAPSEAQHDECRGLRNVTLTWTDQPLDWMVEAESALDQVADTLVAIGREWNADLLHLNLPSQAATIDHGLPVVITSHSCIATWWQALRGDTLPPTWQWQRKLARRGLLRADAVMTPTASHCDALIAAYGPLRKLQVVPNATPMAPLANADEPAVFAAGRWWDEGKNVATLDAAAAQSRSPVMMAGALRGPNGQSVRLQHARSLGELSAGDIFAWMSRAGIFASVAIYEPFGLAVLEAAARGAALVLSGIPTFRELWDGAALFVPPRDVAGVAAAINRLTDDAVLRRRLGELARARAASFSPDRQVERVWKVYETALAAHAPALARVR